MIQTKSFSDCVALSQYSVRFLIFQLNMKNKITLQLKINFSKLSKLLTLEYL